MRIFFVFDETSEEYGLFSKKIIQLQQKCNEHQRFELIETNEQALADTRFNNREFIPTVPKRLIRLRRRMDLKNRTLVSQLRDMMALRRFINAISDKYLGNFNPITSTTARQFREWLALCSRMNEVNDKVMSLDGNLIEQFQMVAKSALDNSDPLSNPLLT